MVPCYVGAEDLVDGFSTNGLYWAVDANKGAMEEPPPFPASDRFVLVTYTSASFVVANKL